MPFPKSSSLRENNISNRPTLVNILPQPPTRAPYGQTKLWKRTPIDFHAEAPPLPSLYTVILAWHAIEGSHRWPRGTGYNTESVQERKKEGGPHLPRETPVFSSISWWLASVAINTDCTRESHSNPADSHSRFLSNRRKKCRVMPHMATYTVRVY